MIKESCWPFTWRRAMSMIASQCRSSPRHCSANSSEVVATFQRPCRRCLANRTCNWSPRSRRTWRTACCRSGISCCCASAPWSRRSTISWRISARLRTRGTGARSAQRDSADAQPGNFDRQPAKQAALVVVVGCSLVMNVRERQSATHRAPPANR